MASKVLCEAPHDVQFTHARDLNETFAGRFFDVYFFESFAIQCMIVTLSFTRLVDSANVAFISYANYHVGVTNFGDYRSNQFLPW